MTVYVMLLCNIIYYVMFLVHCCGC